MFINLEAEKYEKTIGTGIKKPESRSSTASNQPRVVARSLVSGSDGGLRARQRLGLPLYVDSPVTMTCDSLSLFPHL